MTAPTTTWSSRSRVAGPEVGRMIAANGWSEVEYRNLTGGSMHARSSRAVIFDNDEAGAA